MLLNKKLLKIIIIVAVSNISFQSIAKIETISNDIKKEMNKTGTYTKSCPITPERLKLIKFSYIDFDGKHHNDGEIVVMDAVAENVENIFSKLLEIKFPIAKSIRIEHYYGSDELSLADNNTSSYNCRENTDGSSLPSIHSYGLAIDINPAQNPYVAPDLKEKNHAIVSPSSGLAFLNRSNIRPGMAEHIVQIFKENGFSIWGGNWNDPIDWQHFQTSRAVAQFLAVMDPNDAKEFFNLYANNPTLFNKVSYKETGFTDLYKKYPKQFIKIIKDNFNRINELEPNDALEFINSKVKL